jgi:hypothetical protein
MSAAGTGAPQFLLTHYISIIYKTQTFQIEKFVFCIILPDSELAEIAAQIPLARWRRIRPRNTPPSVA